MEARADRLACAHRREDPLGRALAQALGTRPVVLMRGHGVVVVGTSLPQVVFRSVYTEVNARLQGQALALPVLAVTRLAMPVGEVVLGAGLFIGSFVNVIAKKPAEADKLES